MNPGNVNLNSSTEIVGEFLVPGTPEVKISKHATLGGMVEGTGNPEPSNYKIQLNGDSSIQFIYNRVDGENDSADPGST